MDPNSVPSKLLDFLDAQKWEVHDEGEALATAIALLVLRHTSGGGQDWTVDMTVKGKRSVVKVTVECERKHEAN